MANRVPAAALSQVCSEEGDGSIPRDVCLLLVEGSKEVLFVQEGVAGRIMNDLRLSGRLG